MRAMDIFVRKDELNSSGKFLFDLLDAFLMSEGILRRLEEHGSESPRGEALIIHNQILKTLLDDEGFMLDLKFYDAVRSKIDEASCERMGIRIGECMREQYKARGIC